MKNTKGSSCRRNLTCRCQQIVGAHVCVGVFIVFILVNKEEWATIIIKIATRRVIAVLCMGACACAVSVCVKAVCVHVCALCVVRCVCACACVRVELALRLPHSNLEVWLKGQRTNTHSATCTEPIPVRLQQAANNFQRSNRTLNTPCTSRFRTSKRNGSSSAASSSSCSSFSINWLAPGFGAFCAIYSTCVVQIEQGVWFTKLSPKKKPENFLRA